MTKNEFKLTPIALSICSFLMIGSVHAQDTGSTTRTDNDNTTQLPAITIRAQQEQTAFDPVVGYVAKRSATATRTDTPLNEIAQSISVIGAEQIRDQGSQSLSDALRYTPGVTTANSGLDNFGDWFQMRGFGAKIFEDGMTENTSIPEKAEARNEPYAYERIEVLRGPSAVISGNNFPGGMINLVSKRPQATASREISLGIGNHGYKQLSTDLTGPLDTEGKWLYRVIAVGNDSKTQVDHAKSKRAFVRPMISWHPDAATRLTLFAEYQHDDNNTVLGYLPLLGTLYDRPLGNLPSNLFVSEPDWDRARGIRKRIGWELEKELNENWLLKHHFRYSTSDRILQTLVPSYWSGDQIYTDAQGNPDPLNGSYMQRTFQYEAERRYAYATDLLLQGKFKTGSLEHNTLLGFDANNIHGNSISHEGLTTSLNVDNPQYGNFIAPDVSQTPGVHKKMKSYGITLQDQIKIADTFVLTGALRYDNVHQSKNDDQQTDTRLSPRIGLVWLAGGGFSPYISYSESFQALFGLKKYNGGLAKPLVGKQVEAGIKWLSEDQNILVNAAVFNITEENGITPDLNHPGYVEQAAERKGKGFELEAGINMDNWNILAQYAYTENYFSKVDIYRQNTLNQQISGLPKHSASLWVTHNFGSMGLPNLRVGAGLTYKGSTGMGTKNSSTVPSITQVDMMASYQNGPMTFSLNINNLTDKNYLSYCNSSGDCGYGARRRIMGNIAYRW
ncbi:TonB-dependent siderophore receptor [Alcaligenes faecalis]|uniref:TonB-dependent siderophore receptor n=1 Tax=Alcaligenes faecalis TaxID=511 RepID=UPI002933A785|nr:TonB-dependent siderophore receptor [Alcaligenes faecalis]MDV2115303.1 TonB-dependent siderophore receptor [Alcaligenes faecalis]